MTFIKLESIATALLCRGISSKLLGDFYRKYSKLWEYSNKVTLVAADGVLADDRHTKIISTLKAIINADDKMRVYIF